MELEQPVFLRLSQVRVEGHPAKADGDSFGRLLEPPPAPKLAALIRADFAIPSRSVMTPMRKGNRPPSWQAHIRLSICPPTGPWSRSLRMATGDGTCLSSRRCFHCRQSASSPARTGLARSLGYHRHCGLGARSLGSERCVGHGAMPALSPRKHEHWPPEGPRRWRDELGGGASKSPVAFALQTVTRFPIERQRALERVSGVQTFRKVVMNPMPCSEERVSGVQTFRKVVMNPMPGSAPVPGA